MDNQNEYKVEFYRLLSGFLVKQAPAIVICFVAVIAMGGFTYALWERYEANFADIKKELAAAQESLGHCNQERMLLAVKVAQLEVRIDLLQAQPRR